MQLASWTVKPFAVDRAAGSVADQPPAAHAWCMTNTPVPFDRDAYKQRLRETLRLRERHLLSRVPAARLTLMFMRRRCEEIGRSHNFDDVL